MGVASKVIGVSSKDVKDKGVRRVSKSLWNPQEPKIMARDETTGRHINFYQLYNKHPKLFYGMIIGASIYIAMKLRRMMR